jgi:hypothetical protein
MPLNGEVSHHVSLSVTSKLYQPFSRKDLDGPRSVCFDVRSRKLIPPAFAVARTHQPALGPRGELWPVVLMCKEGLCPSSGDINRLMIYQPVIGRVVGNHSTAATARINSTHPWDRLRSDDDGLTIVSSIKFLTALVKFGCPGGISEMSLLPLRG